MKKQNKSEKQIKKFRPFAIIVIIIGVLVVGFELWQSRSNVGPPPVAKASSSVELVHWTHDYSKAIDLAKKSNRPILIDFYATWCGPCKRMAVDVYSQPDSANYINTHFVPVQIDLSNGGPAPIARKLGVRALPTLAILSSKGDVINTQVGYRGKKSMMSWVKANIKKSKSKESI